MKRRWIVVAVAVALLLVAGLTVWLVYRPGKVDAAKGAILPGPGGSVVRLPPGGLSRDARVAITATTIDAPDDVRLVSPAIDVDLGGAHLTAPAIVTLPLTAEGQTGDDYLFAATVDQHGRLVNAGGRIDEGGKTFTFAAPHMSRWVILAKIGKAVDIGVRLVQNAGKIWTDVTYRAKDPECAGPSPLWNVSTPGGGAVKACVQGDTDDPDRPTVLKVNNNRAYPQFLQLRQFGLTAPDPPGGAEDWAAAVWQELAAVNPDYTYLPARGEQTVVVPPLPRRVTGFAVRPAVEAVIAQVVVDVLKTFYAPVEASVEMVNCVLGAKGGTNIAKAGEFAEAVLGCLNYLVATVETIAERPLADVPVDPAKQPVAICKDGSVSYTKSYPEACKKNGGILHRVKDDKPEDPAAKRTRLLDQIAVALADVPEALVTIGFGSWETISGQQVVAAPTMLVATQTADGGQAVPEAVRNKAGAVAGAALRYPAEGLEPLYSQLPPAGLAYGNGADADQGPSTQLGSELTRLTGPHGAAALARLLQTIPRRATCPETGQDGFVYEAGDRGGGVDALLRRSGYHHEEREVLTKTGPAEGGYRACITPDGQWSSFTRTASGTGFPGADADKLAERKLDENSGCSLPLTDAFLPNDSYCHAVSLIDLDGDGRPDRLVSYYRHHNTESDVWFARAILAKGVVSDVQVPAEFDGESGVMQAHYHADLDGVPGQEVLVPTLIGAHGTDYVILTVDNDRLRFVTTEGQDGPAHLILDAARNSSGGLACPTVAGHRELQHGGWTSSGDEGPTSATLYHFTWKGKTLVPGATDDKELPGRPGPEMLRPPYRDFGC